MVAKKYRLGAKDIVRVRKTVLALPLFRVKAERSRFPYNRFGVVLGAKTGTSVGRHRLKRKILDEAGRWDYFSKDVVFIASPAVKKSTQEEITKELERVRTFFLQH